MKVNQRAVTHAGIQMYLRIKHPALHPNQITDTLKFQPEEVRAAGASVTQGGMPQVHSESYWIAALPYSTPTDLLEDIRTTPLVAANPNKDAVSFRRWARLLKHGHYELNTLLAISLAKMFGQLDVQKSFLQRINEEGGSVTLLIQRTNYGEPVSLAPAILAELAALGMGIEIN